MNLGDERISAFLDNESTPAWQTRQLIKTALENLTAENERLRSVVTAAQNLHDLYFKIAKVEGPTDDEWVEYHRAADLLHLALGVVSTVECPECGSTLYVVEDDTSDHSLTFLDHLLDGCIALGEDQE